jgi:hypothetical protein
MRPVIGLLLSTLLVTVTPFSVNAQEEGLLLGLRYQETISTVPPYYAGRADSLSRSVYHTLLVVKRDGKISVVGDTEGLIIPRGSALWRVDTKRSVYNDWVEDFVWAAPVGEIPDLPGIQAYNGEHCRGSRSQRILFAGENHLGLEQYSAGYCEGAVHPWIFNTLAVVPTDSTIHLGLPITEVAGAGAHRAFAAATRNFLETAADESQRERYAEGPDEANWSLVRRRGLWRMVGRIETGDAAGGAFSDLELTANPPPSVVGHNQVNPHWDRIKAFAPDAVDAFSSPRRDLIVIIHRTRLTVHSVERDRIAPAAVTLQLRPETRAVMAHWAEGTQVGRWIEQISQHVTVGNAALR